FWHPVLVLPDGKATVSFAVADEITRYRVLVAGHSLDGRLGALTHTFEVRKPFSVEVKLPREVTASDVMNLPVMLANDTDEPRDVNLQVRPKNLAGATDFRTQLRPTERGRKLFQFKPTILEGVAELTVDGKTEPFAPDTVRRSVAVVPEGFPFVGS